MQTLIEVLTSKTGAVAALVVVLGIVAAVAGIVRPTLERRRKAREATACLRFSSLTIKAVPSYGTSGEAEFQLQNSGGGVAVLRALKLAVLEAHPCERLRMIDAGAPVPEHRYQVKLDPHTREYDVRARTFAPETAALSFKEAEVETFKVRLTSDEPWWYRFEIVAEWYDAKRPLELESTCSNRVEIEFPPDPAQVLASAQ